LRLASVSTRTILSVDCCSEERWIELTFPAIAEREEYISIWPGDLLHPEQQDREFLEALRSQELEIFAAQYQQSPIPPDGFLIRRDQIQYCDELPKITPSSVYIQSWDTGQKPGETNARSACLESLIESFIELMSQVFMLPIFHRRTSC
jgi:hypothetical protein